MLVLAALLAALVLLAALAAWRLAPRRLAIVGISYVPYAAGAARAAVIAFRFAAAPDPALVAASSATLIDFRPDSRGAPADHAALISALRGGATGPLPLALVPFSPAAPGAATTYTTNMLPAGLEARLSGAVFLTGTGTLALHRRPDAPARQTGAGPRPA